MPRPKSQTFVGSCSPGVNHEWFSGSGDVAGDQLRTIVERIESIEEEIKELTEAKKEIYLEAKGNGFDVKTLREVIRVRKQDQKERDELETRTHPVKATG